MLEDVSNKCSAWRDYFILCMLKVFVWGGGGCGVLDSDVDRVRVSYKVLAFVPDGYLLKLNSSDSF